MNWRGKYGNVKRKVAYRHKTGEFLYISIYFRFGEIPVILVGAQNNVWNQVVKGVTQVSIIVRVAESSRSAHMDLQILPCSVSIKKGRTSGSSLSAKQMSRDITKPTNECAPIEDSDQPGLPPSLIRVFADRMKKDWVLSSHWADSEDSDQTGLTLICWFCHVVAQILRGKGSMFVFFSVERYCTTGRKWCSIIALCVCLNEFVKSAPNQFVKVSVA